MFGLENNKKGPEGLEFELAMTLQDEGKRNALIKKTDKTIQTLKNQMRAGASSDDFEKLGALLKGYAALLKILNNPIKSEKST